MSLIDSEEGDADTLVQFEELVFHGDSSFGADVYYPAFTCQRLTQDAFVCLGRAEKASGHADVCELCTLVTH